MAKIAGKGDKKITFYALGGLLVAGLIVSFFISQTAKAPAPSAVTNGAGKAGSLGSTSEGSTAYNQLFQERVLKTMNQSLEQMRAENAAKFDAAQREQQNHDADRDNRLQETLSKVLEAQEQRAQETRPSGQVEKISLSSTDSGSKGKNQTDSGGFFGSPSDVKNAASDAVGEIQKAVEGKTEVAGLDIPPNGFIKARTLNGIVAVVGEPAKGFLAKLEGRYRAANGFVVNLDSCTAYIEGRADLSSGRVIGKPVTLTCNFVDGTSKTWQVSGYVVDKDGIEGIVGIINDNSGKKLAGATLASGVAAAGGALSRAQTQSYTSSAGTAQAVTGSVGSDIGGGVIQGAGTELSKQVIDHYNQYLASVQVGGNREITVVLLNELAVPDAGKDITVTHGVGTQKGQP